MNGIRATNAQAQATTQALKEWRQIKDAALVVLTYAKARNIIGEVVIDEGASMLRVAEMSADEKALLSKLPGRPGRQHIEAALKLAGSSLAQQREERLSKLIDTPATRAAARAKMGL